MLTLTDNAHALVKDLTVGQELPETAGLRLAMAPGQAALEVTVVPEPQPNDQAVGGGEVPVYVSEEAAPLLDDKTLDAAQTPEGIGFTLQPQGGGDQPA